MNLFILVCSVLTCFNLAQAQIQSKCDWDEYIYLGSCTKVPDGCYTSARDETDLKACPDGNYCRNNQVFQCPAGTYQKSKHYCMDMASCDQVSDGCYQDKAGSSDYHGCPEGYYCPDPASSPIPCPPGTYAKPNRYYCFESLGCEAVSNGCWQTLSGQTSYNKCPLGHYCPDPAQGPIPCPPGTYQDPDPYYCFESQYCKSVPTGCYQPEFGQTQYLRCPDGHCCNDDEAIPCPPDFQYSGSSYCNSHHYCWKGSQGISCDQIKQMYLDELNKTQNSTNSTNSTDSTNSTSSSNSTSPSNSSDSTNSTNLKLFNLENLPSTSSSPNFSIMWVSFLVVIAIVFTYILGRYVIRKRKFGFRKQVNEPQVYPTKIQLLEELIQS